MDSQSTSKTSLRTSPIFVPLDVTDLILKQSAAEEQLKTVANISATCKSLQGLARPVLWEKVYWTKDDWRKQQSMRETKGVRENWACINTTTNSSALELVQYPSSCDQWTVWFVCRHSPETVYGNLEHTLVKICAADSLPRRMDPDSFHRGDQLGFTRRKEEKPIPFQYEVSPTFTTFHCTSARNRSESLAEYLERKDEECLADAASHIADNLNIRFRLVQVDTDREHFERIYQMFLAMNKLYRRKWRFTKMPINFYVRNCALDDIQEWINVVARAENPYSATPLCFRVLFQLQRVDSRPPFTDTMHQIHRLLESLHADPEKCSKLPTEIAVNLDYMKPRNRLLPLSARFELRDPVDTDNGDTIVNADEPVKLHLGISEDFEPEDGLLGMFFV
ncbi:hypothetical protein QFC21_004012 [Naganishia friedmannii]|uniref:Uncharacterized protein n=1 Tax=Naganishia friedmannii TaxID=89922 RepID=A0ACC2VJ16_9TREE|nr:hypothetical protein QFC21_004012 [Naganishia friedmannii]